MLHSKLALVAISFLLALPADPRLLHAAVPVTVVNLDGAGEGFNDAAGPDPFSTAGGNPGATLGAQRLLAFQFAANIWAGLIDGGVEIKIGARGSSDLQ